MQGPFFVTVVNLRTSVLLPSLAGFVQEPGNAADTVSTGLKIFPYLTFQE